MDPRKFGYGRQRTTERLPSVETLRIGVKNTSQGREGNPRRVSCVSLWREINHFRGNQWILYSNGDKILRKRALIFSSSRFWSRYRSNLVSSPPRGQNLDR